MKYLLVVFLSLLMTGCASTASQEGDDSAQVKVTGTRVAKSDFDEGELTVVKPEEGETQGEMLIRLMGGADMPKSDSYSSCKELLTVIKRNEKIKISSLTDTLVIASSGRVTANYKFPEGGCL